jgi:hypothetical protein
VKGKFEFKPPKTRTSLGTIGLPGMTVEALREQYEAHLEERLPLAWDATRARSCSHVLAANLDPDTLSRSFGRLITAAKVTRITFHGAAAYPYQSPVVSERAGGAGQREHHATPTPPTSQHAD